MATIPEAMAIALQHHQAGRLQAAEHICRQVLAVEPNQVDALHLLGVIAHQAGKHAIAVEYFGRAITLRGNVADYHNNLANALHEQGRLDDAVACLRQAIRLQPDFAGAHNNLGNALHEQGRLDEAVACLRQAIRLQPEESIRLADAFWCYDPLSSEPAVSALPALHEGYIMFGCLNNFCKVNDAVLKLWAQVLKAVDPSRLMLLGAEGPHHNHTLGLLEQEGVKPERVIFSSRLPRPRYLELYHRIDIGLDTFPYTGQTTSLNAFWMGAPVITIVGQTAVARAGLSLLGNLG
ncbi:MAG TPA: tetratricopeptide repeat protein, partial [Gemmataceae bacterium]|nr:tetratricopeptide repeat protein [Gemmataceae bacterium]